MSARTPVIAGNWKMFTTNDQALALVEDMLDQLDALEGVEVVICPPFISLAALAEMLGDTQVRLGAQNLFWEEKGAFTGEVSAAMLAPLCQYVIIGHSERRQFFGETNLIVERKTLAALAHGLKPIVCVGENLDQRDAGRTFEIVHGQVRSVFDSLTAEQAQRCVIAYEPVWAIGTGRPAGAEQAQEVLGTIRGLLTDIFDSEVAGQIRLQYGGSVNAQNIGEFMREPDIDGALVGGASLKPDEFVRICAVTQQVKH